MTTANPGGTRPWRAWAGVVVSLLPSLILPLVIFYVLGVLGLGVIQSSLLAGVPPLAVTVHGLVRRRSLNRIALFTLVLFLLEAALTIALFLLLGRRTTGLSRLVLARDGVTTALAGCLMLASLLRRPLIVELMRSRAERLGLVSVLDGRWSTDGAFRRGMRLVTAVWGVGLLADAGVRVLIALLVPVRVVPALQALQYLVVFCLLLTFQAVYMSRTGLLLSAPAPAARAAR